jgi:stage V sporulation protein K
MNAIKSLFGIMSPSSAADSLRKAHDRHEGVISVPGLLEGQKIVVKYSDPRNGPEYHSRRIEDLLESGPYTPSQEQFVRKCCGLEPLGHNIPLRRATPMHEQLSNAGDSIRQLARTRIDHNLAEAKYELVHWPLINNFTGSSDSSKRQAVRSARLAYGSNTPFFAAVESQVSAIPSASIIDKLLDKNLPVIEAATKGNVLEAYPPGEAADKLESMIGLPEVKNEIRLLINYVRVENNRLKDSCLASSDKLNLNVFFGGNPGTGKTQVARLYGSLLKDAGILQSGHVVVATRSDLVAEYLGQTGLKTRKLIEKAQGGVLFIDEAHLLVSKGMYDFAHEAVSELMVSMVEKKGLFAVVFATYPSQKTDFFGIDPGLQRRIPTQLTFPDYSDIELANILIEKVKAEDFILDRSIALKIGAHIGRGRKLVNFGNGGAVETELDNAKKRFASRVLASTELRHKLKTEKSRLLLSDFGL